LNLSVGSLRYSIHWEPSRPSSRSCVHWSKGSNPVLRRSIALSSPLPFLWAGALATAGSTPPWLVEFVGPARAKLPPSAGGVLQSRPPPPCLGAQRPWAATNYSDCRSLDSVKARCPWRRCACVLAPAHPLGGFLSELAPGPRSGF
jgi:hypothetical protein